MRAATNNLLQREIASALETRGLSARAASEAVVGHDGLIRDIKRGNVPTADKLAGLADVLGLEFYFGPPRDVALETRGFHEPAPADWHGPPLPFLGFARAAFAGRPPDPPSNELPSPPRRQHEGSAYMIALGDGMKPEGIHNGDVLLVAPEETPAQGRRVVYRAGEVGGRMALLSSIDGDFLIMRSWAELTAGRGLQQMEDRLRADTISELWWITHVIDGAPGEQAARLRDWPRRPAPREPEEYVSPEPDMAMIARALDLPVGATAEQIVERARVLKQSNEEFLKAADAISSVAAGFRARLTEGE
ncbi:MAG: hypothetical protein AAF192_00260 [Pseudomonadota bacterium]